MKPARLFSDYGMIGVLVALCVFFSAVTFDEQPATGPAAAAALAEQIATRFGSTARVLVAARTTTEDERFARKLERDLIAAGIRPNVVVGEPKDVRAELSRLAADNKPLNAVAATGPAAAWLLIVELNETFPNLGRPAVLVPQSRRWPNFLKTDNLLNIANQISVIAIVAIGMTMVIITGGIDLSVGSLIALAAVLSAKLVRDAAGGLQATPIGMTVACAAAIAACGIVGAFTGLMITRFAVPPFIVTLAMMLVGSGLAYILSRGQSIYEIPESFTWLGRGADLFGLPNAVVLMILLYAGAHVLMSRMRLGRYLYAVGGNREAARLSGVPVNRVLLFAYTASALLAALGGVIMTSQLKSGSPTYGGMYELYVIAAVVVGGTSLSGGEGRMLGTLTGAFIIAVIQNGMNLTNIESYTQKVTLGAVILIAVLVDKLRRPRA